MKEESRFMVDVGMKDVPFPITVPSRENPDGQKTVANIAVTARIMHEFEAHWIDRFIETLHRHRDKVGPKTLRDNLADYVRELRATVVKVDFDYPYFVEKLTPASKEKCWVRYHCSYSAKVPSVDTKATVFSKIRVPCITTYPGSDKSTKGGLFGQVSFITVETESSKDIYHEDLVELVDRHALAPVFSFLTEPDREFLIDRIHSQKKTSVEVVDGIKTELSRNRDIGFYSVSSANYGLLQSYSTIIATEKSLWVPFSGYDDEI